MGELWVRCGCMHIDRARTGWQRVHHHRRQPSVLSVANHSAAQPAPAHVGSSAEGNCDASTSTSARLVRGHKREARGHETA